MRTQHSFGFTSPLLTLLTGISVTLALIAITIAATSSPVIAESAFTPAKFAVSPDEAVISGTIVGVGDGLIGVQDANGVQPVAFPVAAGAALSRDGNPAKLADLRKNDPVHMIVDRSSGAVLQLVAEPAPTSPFRPSTSLAIIAMLGLIAGAITLIARRRTPLGVIEITAKQSTKPARRLGLADLSLNRYIRRRQPECQA